MIKILPARDLFVSSSKISGAGRGVFTSHAIGKGETIEKSPVILLPNEAKNLQKSELFNYYFLWSKEKKSKSCAIALGFGSIYNHSYEPNATYKKRLRENVVEFIAIRAIQAGEEITVNYNYGDAKDQSPLWIKSIKPPSAK